MQCQKCGAALSPGARFCPTCGAPVNPADARRPARLSSGQTMNNGQYRVQRALGKGGMGAIYLAENTQAFDRLCVIKEMLAYFEPGEEAKAQARFEEEARTLANLKHPGIPDMYGYFSENGHNYIVMEYIEGDDFEKVVARSTLPSGGLAEDDVVRYGIEICRVLEYLARVQPEPVVHCDIKPANIIVDRNSQQAVLVDFGTARGRSAGSGTPSTTASTKPSAKRPSVYGTVGYAAPEMFSGLPVPKSDVFALAATLYYLLTADDPRDHPFAWPQMERIPGPLRLILERALTENLQERADAEQFRQQLDAYRASKAGTIRPLTFPGGNQATTVTGVLDLAMRYWDYAREILYDGSLDAWLRQVAHDPVASDRAREAIAENPDAPDLGLDTFVRSLNPRIPAPRLTLEGRTPAGSTARTGASGRKTLTLTNHGPGAAHGSIDSATDGVRCSPATFLLSPGETLEVTVDARGSQPRAAKPQVVITPQAGLPISVEVGAAAPSAAPRPNPAHRPRFATPAPQPRPSAVSQPRPQAGRAKLRVWTLIALLGLAGLAYSLRGRIFPSVGTVNSGIAALEAGDWQRARSSLSRLDPTDDASVARVALLLGYQRAWLPGGTLMMGSDEGALDQRPVHAVQVATFAIDRFEVTNVQYQHFCRETGHATPSHWQGDSFPRGEALRPVVNVTWEDALAYAAWLGRRLPTEAEWEWATRGAEGRLYPWGDQASSSSGGAARANTLESGPGRTVDVGGYPEGATPDGVWDLAGNVREWTANLYAPYDAPQQGTPGGPIAVRGSSWNSYDDVASARQRVVPTEMSDDLGFRCASDN